MEVKFKAKSGFGRFKMNEDLRNNFDVKQWFLAFVLDLPWFEILGKLWGMGRKIIRGLANEGVYEVLDYQCELELKDKRGRFATIKKQVKIRYLQDQVLSYQDWAWGDTKVFLDYRCSPGTPVDQFRLGHKTCQLISLREFRNKGDTDNFNIEWNMRNGFLKSTGFWATGIRYRTNKVHVKLIFPKNRHPSNISIIESNRQRTQTLGAETQKLLADGRVVVSWENSNPRLFENYVLKWEW